MTITSQVNTWGPYVGTNSAGQVFTVSDKFISETDLAVVQTDSAGVPTTLTLTTDYTVTGAGVASGGTVTVIAAVPVTSTITINDEIPYTQPTALPLGGEFASTSVELAIDRVVKQVQRVKAFTEDTVASVVAGDLDQTPTGSFWLNDSPVAVIDRLNDRVLIGPDLEDYDGYQPPVSTTWLGLAAEAIVNISAISKAAAGLVTTSTAHGFTAGDKIYIASVGGMVEVTDGNYIVGTVAIPTTFELKDTDSVDIDTQGYTTYTSGGTVKRPQNRQPGLDWIEKRSQTASYGGYGVLAGSFATHNSDAPNAGGASIAVTAAAVNDSTTYITDVWATYIDCKRAVGADGGVFGMELAIANMDPSISRLSAYNSDVGPTIGIMMAAGADSSINGDTSDYPVSCGLRFIQNGGRFGVGVAFQLNSLFDEADHASSPGTYQRAIEMTTGNQIQWIINDEGNEDPPFAWIKGVVVGSTIGTHALGVEIGDGKFKIKNNAQKTQFQVTQAASTVNYVSLISSTTGNGPFVNVDGDDDNIDLKLGAKGTGIIIPQDDVSMASGKTYQVTGTQVVTARQTGWTTIPTGTLNRLTFVSDTVTLPDLAARVAALIIDIRTHGLTGA